MKELHSGWIIGQQKIRYFRYSNYSLLIEWPKSKSRNTLNKINHCVSILSAADITGVNEVVPGYHSLMIYFEPSATNHMSLIERLDSITFPSNYKKSKQEVRIIEVSYARDVALDIDFVAQSTGLSTSEVIDIHSSTIYDIHFIGFLPGFLYLGGLDKRLNLPRRDTPRVRVPAGSVALAVGQTGIYPIDSPGGWHVIGKTEQQFFNPSTDPPCTFTSGMKIQFKSI